MELNACGKIVNFEADSGVNVMAVSEKKLQLLSLTAEPTVATPNNPRGSINIKRKVCL